VTASFAGILSVAKDLLLFLLYKRGQYLEKKPGN